MPVSLFLDSCARNRYPRQRGRHGVTGFPMLRSLLTIVSLSAFCAFVIRETLAQGEGQTSANSTAASAGVCGTGGSCCIIGGQGCNDVVCCTAVCADDPFCCTDEWDELCVGHAEKMC